MSDDGQGQLVRKVGINHPSFAATSVIRRTSDATNKPFAQLIGPTKKNACVKVNKITVGLTVATTAAYVDLTVARRDVLGSAGTAVAITPVSLSAALPGFKTPTCTATANVYTAGMTAGTGGGIVAQQLAFAPVTATAAKTDATVFEWALHDEQTPLMLYSATDSIEISAATAFGTVPTYTVTFEFEEYIAS
jgi:hypothetical protein